MKCIKLFSLLYLWIPIGLVACAQADNEKNESSIPVVLSDELREAYGTGQPLILYSYRDEIVSSEAYGDWEFYLDAFKQEDGKNYLYSRVSSEEFESLKVDGTEFTLFMKKGHPTFLYKGLIVEPQVYTAVHRKFSNEPLVDVDRAFMPEEF